MVGKSVTIFCVTAFVYFNMRHEFTLRGEKDSLRVWINQDELSPIDSQNLANHSPDGFNWGYSGSGPSQLALAILLHFDCYNPLENFQDFKRQHIATLEDGDFEIKINIQPWL